MPNERNQHTYIIEYVWYTRIYVGRSVRYIYIYHVRNIHVYGCVVGWFGWLVGLGWVGLVVG